jgi:hypothetical protein
MITLNCLSTSVHLGNIVMHDFAVSRRRLLEHDTQPKPANASSTFTFHFSAPFAVNLLLFLFVPLGVLGALVVDLFDFHAPFTDLQRPVSCP